ncbi:MAG: hypothetical protein R3326_03085 [Gemmatimonadota bacterium]|nr:hypothetical protein [Gemmatimonadota bacterium]
MRAITRWTGSIVGVLLFATAVAGQEDPAPMFRTSDRCLACHNGLVTPSGRDVSFGTDWRASMMANAARDPYWHAAVRRETIDHPESSAAVQNECSTCHMPMMHTRIHASGEGPAGVFEHLPTVRGMADGGTPVGALAADGVSCAMCHQITEEGLGTEESFVGGFVVVDPSAGTPRRVFGPFAVDSGRTRIMRSATEFRPAESDHVSSSEVCATCHTLYTHALGDGGEVIGELPEQVPYLEWLHSDYAGKRSCASCHMPEISEPTPISGVLGQAREGVNRHAFKGGNFFLTRMFNRYADETGVAATPTELEAAAGRTLEHLRTRAARLAVERVEVDDGSVAFDVVVENLAGHKLPTAYPSRRAWLHVTVRDADGRPVFESGALESDGSIAGNDNDADPARFEPHRAEIRDEDQVQIYEAILAGPDGTVTTGLLTAVEYAKDNRVLPDGFDPASADADIAVYGAATEDEDFAGGGDRVRYVVDPAESAGPYAVEAELWYQPIGFRWARNLAPYRTAETDRFVRFYDSMSEVSAALLARERIAIR